MPTNVEWAVLFLPYLDLNGFVAHVITSIKLNLSSDSYQALTWRLIGETPLAERDWLHCSACTRNEFFRPCNH